MLSRKVIAPVMKIVIATLILAALLGMASSLVAAATASPGARWLVLDTASDYDPSGYTTTANVSDWAGLQSGGIPIVPRAARVRVRAPRGPVELRMNTECNPINEFAGRSYDLSVTKRFSSKGHGQWVTRSLPFPAAKAACLFDAYFSVWVVAGPGALQLKLEVLSG